MSQAGSQTRAQIQKYIGLLQDTNALPVCAMCRRQAKHPAIAVSVYIWLIHFTSPGVSTITATQTIGHRLRLVHNDKIMHPATQFHCVRSSLVVQIFSEVDVQPTWMGDHHKIPSVENLNPFVGVDLNL